MTIRFGPFTLCGRSRQLMRDGREIHLTPKAFQLLLTLAENRPDVVSKSTLLQRLWLDTFVAEANLSNLVSEIRQALDDRRRVPQWIRTAHGYGYAFCGEVMTPAGTPETEREPPGFWLEWGRRRIPLGLGEHIIGRDSDVDVRLAASTVSRRHARLTVRTSGAVLEDFGSKNGTRLGSQRVMSPMELMDGDVIHFGSLLLTFHVRVPGGSTETQGQ